MFYSFPPPVFAPGLIIYLIDPRAFEAPPTIAHRDKIGPMGKNIKEILKKVKPRKQVTAPPNKEEKASPRDGSRFF
jgi:hypothetical protein